MTNFFNDVNVFTDSACSNSKKTHYTNHVCSGFIVVHDNYVIDSGTMVFENVTNNFGELFAIGLGVKSLLKIKQPCRMNIFSDSLLSVSGLRDWYKGWMWNAKNGVWYNSTGAPVINQELFSYIISMIFYNQLVVKIYHVKGHVFFTDEKVLNKMIRQFWKYNGIEIDSNTAKYLAMNNSKIDKLVGNVLRSTNVKDYDNAPIPICVKTLGRKDIYKYKRLVTNS